MPLLQTQLAGRTAQGLSAALAEPSRGSAGLAWATTRAAPHMLRVPTPPAAHPLMQRLALQKGALRCLCMPAVIVTSSAPRCVRVRVRVCVRMCANVFVCVASALVAPVIQLLPFYLSLCAACSLAVCCCRWRAGSRQKRLPCSRSWRPGKGEGALYLGGAWWLAGLLPRQVNLTGSTAPQCLCVPAPCSRQAEEKQELEGKLARALCMYQDQLKGAVKMTFRLRDPTGSCSTPVQEEQEAPGPSAAGAGPPEGRGEEAALLPPPRSQVAEYARCGCGRGYSAVRGCDSKGGPACMLSGHLPTTEGVTHPKAGH